MALPREILQWLRGLELTESIAKPTRDLANGFVVVEILSKYFPRDFQLYKFSTGLSSRSRKYNWEKIDKVIAKIGLTIPPRLLEGTANLRTDAAVLLLIFLFERLTGKRTQSVHPIQNSLLMDLNYQLSLPRHQRYTLSHAVRTNYKTPEVVIRNIKTTAEEKIRFIIEVFEKEQRHRKRIELAKLHTPTVLEKAIRREGTSLDKAQLMIPSGIASSMISKELLGHSTGSTTLSSSLQSTSNRPSKMVLV